jgi:hypothetical protein
MTCPKDRRIIVHTAAGCGLLVDGQILHLGRAKDDVLVGFLDRRDILGDGPAER